MAMSKQDFIALADAIREHNTLNPTAETPFTSAHLETLAHFCKRQNYNFMKSRWVGYIDGTNGPSGGTIKAPKTKDTVTYSRGIGAGVTHERITEASKHRYERNLDSPDAGCIFCSKPFRSPFHLGQE